MVQVFVLLLLLEVSLHCLLAAPAVYAGAFFIMVCPMFDKVLWEFFRNFWGVGVLALGILNPVFGKFDLRVQNSVYVLTIGPPQFGVVGDGWGQRNSQLNRLLASLFSPIVCKLDLSLREIALVTTQPTRGLSPRSTQGE